MEIDCSADAIWKFSDVDDHVRHVHIIKCTLRFLMSPSVYVNKKSMLTSIFCPVNCILNWCLLEVDGQ